jgi:hypothetical protein
MASCAARRSFSLPQAGQDFVLAWQDLIALEFIGLTEQARGAAFPV